jgi:phage-related minor tail protein
LDEVKANREAKHLKAREDLRQRIEKMGGVWLTADEVTMGLLGLEKKGEQIKAVKDQMHHHQLNSHVDKANRHLTQFSSKGIIW